MFNVEQQFNGLWLVVVHNVPEEWAEIKASRMRYCGIAVRLVPAD